MFSAALKCFDMYHIDHLSLLKLFALKISLVQLSITLV